MSESSIGNGGRGDWRQRGYFQTRGERRRMIGEDYNRDRVEAQDLGRYKNMETTREAYSHLDAEEQRERLDDLVEDF